MNIQKTILAIESSCDDTAAAVLKNGVILSNIVAGQDVHVKYGGVVPELASRAHQQHIVPVVDQALKQANVNLNDLDAIAFTSSPGLIGSLLVGAGFAKSIALALNLPLITVNHMEAHVLAHFIDEPKPRFPFMCLTVSGGHTMINIVHSAHRIETIGKTIDDAAGEAFDKAAKLLNLPYPGGPLIDKYAKDGNPLAFKFPIPQIDGYNYSFSGIKTAFMNFVNRERANNENFIEQQLNDICASIQHTIIEHLIGKLIKAAADFGITDVGIAGGVSANSALRNRITELGKTHRWNVYVPEFQYCTDNAAMIAMAAQFKLEAGLFSSQDVAPSAR